MGNGYWAGLERPRSRKRQIVIEAWGIHPERIRPLLDGAFAVYDPRKHDSPAQAVCNSIARRTRLDVLSARSDGTRLDDRGQPEANVYEVTLVRYIKRGGRIVAGQLWIAVPVYVD